MSNCRFKNTLSDLRDCLEIMQEGKDLSGSEQAHKKKLLKLCADILDDFGHEIDVQVCDLEHFVN